jgi:hypothetical protein
MNKQVAYELGVELAMRDAGLVKEAGLFGPSEDEVMSRGGKMFAGGLTGLTLGSALGGGGARLATEFGPLSRAIDRMGGTKGKALAALATFLPTVALGLGGARLGEHAMSGEEGREYWMEKLKALAEKRKND